MPATSQIAVISSSVDAQFTARLVTDLRAVGWHVLDVAKTDLADAQHHLTQLQSTRIYLIILSQEALHSAWLNAEIERVQELARAEPDRRVVPLRLMPLEMPESLAALETVDFATAVYDAALARLQEALSSGDGAPVPEAALVGAGKRKARASRPRGSAADGSHDSSVSDDSSPTSSQEADPAAPASVPAASLGSPAADPAPDALDTSTIAVEPAPFAEPASPIEAAEPLESTTEVLVTPVISLPDSVIPTEAALAAAPADTLAPGIPIEPVVSSIPAEPLAASIADEIGANGAVDGQPPTQVTTSRFLRVDGAGSELIPADDDVMVTVYAPGEVERRVWTRLLVYASRETRYALAQVAADAEARLAGQRSQLRSLGSQRLSLLRRGARLTLVPTLPGFAFDPPAQVVKWDDGVQCHELRLRALTAPAAIAARGSLHVYLGPLLLAEVPLAVMVREPGAPASASAGYASSVGRAFRRIFASFAPEDADLVRTLASCAETLADPYLRDALAARDSAPEGRWAAAIANADVFELFWSDHAAHSMMVEREWRHALSASVPRSHIRGLYWSSRLYPTPAELRAVSFEPLDPARAGLGHTLALFGRR